jgi:hypothetical protein
MRAKANILLPLMLIFLPLNGCKLFPFIKDMPFHIKAVIEGEIKGHKIHCEKTLDLTDGKWGVMCKVGNDMDVKYRVRPMSNDLAQIEFVVGKFQAGRNKIIAAPTMVIKKAHSAKNVTTTNNANIMVMAERL